MFSWNNYYYSNNNPEKIYENKDFISINDVLNITSNNSYVFNCYFHDIHSNSNGSAIFHSLSESSVLIEKCTFFNCSSSQNVGMINVLSRNCIIAYVCGQYGHSQENAFSFISANYVNSIIDSSISYCQADNTHIIRQATGNINIKSVNLSHNKANERSGIYCAPNKIDTKTGFANQVIFCSFANNIADKQFCVVLSNYYTNSDYKHEIKTSSIIKNKGENTIYSSGKASITQSCIIDNDDPCFCTFNEKSNIILHNCTVTNKITSQSGTIIQSETTNPFIVALSFIETGSCHNLFIYIHPSLKRKTHKEIFFSTYNLFLNFILFIICK